VRKYFDYNIYRHNTQEEVDEQNALHILRRLTNNSNTTWKSPLQWQAIKEVLKRSNDMLLVMATGGGKTMVAIIPTLIDGNVSVIVLPLNSLITDYKRKFDTMGIKYDHYTSSTRTLRQDVHFIFVSADMAKTASWKQCILDLNDHVEVTRLFFDEAHLPLLNHDFRAALNHLSDLRVLPMQFILLTGTAPPSSEKELYKIFGLISSNTITLRGPTDRPELYYNILPHASTYDEAFSFVKKTLEGYSSSKIKKPRDAVLIFVPYIDVGERLSKDLGCAFYSGKISDSAQREQIYLSWYNGNNSILVATSALSLGNDHPFVKLIIHFGTPLEMMSYVQEVSRGGRTGQPAACILIPMSKRQPRAIQDEDYTGINAMYHFVWKEKGCFRYAITFFFDGIGVYCQNNCMKCSNCRHKDVENHQLALIAPPVIIQSSPEVLSGSEATSRKRKSIGKTTAFEDQLHAAKKRKTERSLELLKYVEVFKSCLSVFQSTCAYCLVFKKSSVHNGLFKCPVLYDKIPEYKAWKKSIKYNPRYPNKSCWFCHLPQCHDLLHPQFSTADACNYPDIVAPVAFAIFQIDKYRQEAEIHFEVQWPSIKEFTEWLVGPPYKNEQTNISALFLWYTLGNYFKP
jgi:superfamily II DNA helicase RecQ